MNISINNLVPITQFYDTNSYDGYNASAGINQGLAEYTNANFFSNDTLFAAEQYSFGNKHYFPYPKKSSTNLQEYLNQNLLPEVIVGEDNIPDTSFWIKKERDGEEIEHFVRPGYFTKYINPFISLYYRTFFRDDKCHEDYAQKLIPRAVGYSAGLLNYFFRGNIEITLPDTGVYGKTDNPANGFTEVKLLAKNITTNNEEMPNGSIELVIKYKLALSDPFQSGMVDTAEEYTYIVVSEKDGKNTIPRDNAVELTFDLTQNPIPLWATDVYLQIVFKGKLGMEEGAVAVGLKDISEPTPIDVYNNNDKICINGMWYEAGSDSAIAQVDANDDGRAWTVYENGQWYEEWDVYQHDIKNMYIRFSPVTDPKNASPTDYSYHTSNIPAGSLKRALFILTDYGFKYSFYITRTIPDPDDWWGHLPSQSIYPGTAIGRQTNYIDGSYVDTYPVFYNFRGSDMWWGGGLIYINWPYPADSQCILSLL
ncbi:MAG: hypothetical protein HY758_02995 [Nitrospirae bacterium]|nr:hypothetical protein [Nitrospirota bacterium]